MVPMQLIKRIVILVLLIWGLSGCVLTRIVTTPMRVGGAITTVVPVLGDAAYDAINQAADAIDELPF